MKNFTFYYCVHFFCCTYYLAVLVVVFFHNFPLFCEFFRRSHAHNAHKCAPFISRLPTMLKNIKAINALAALFSVRFVCLVIFGVSVLCVRNKIVVLP